MGRGLVAEERLLGQIDGDDLLVRLPAGQLRRPEHRDDRLLGPLLDPLPLGQGDDRVAPREVLERRLDDRGEGLENTLSARRHRREHRQAPGVQRAVEGLGLQHVGQVPLVVLQDHRDRVRVELLREQVPLQLTEGLHVLVEAVGGGVGDEHDAVRPAQHHAARRRVDRLARHRRELEAQVEPAEAARLQRQQVAEDRAVLLRVHGNELAPPPAAGAIVEDLEVRGLPADRGPVVGDLDLDDPLLPVELDHVRLSGSSATTPENPEPRVGTLTESARRLPRRRPLC